jgi:2-polyprenyl-3-methyl-5-hydroxy-6-metoxy-1,4-benzoquinol methylase
VANEPSVGAMSTRAGVEGAATKRATGAEHQAHIDRGFDAWAQHWKDLYGERTLEGVIHQGRRALTLAWIDELGLPEGANVLEVGCGAGLLALELAARGYDVRCIDSSPAMVDLAKSQVADTELAGALSIDVGDVHALAFGSGAFELVIALGVVPFLHDARRAVVEMARVVRPDGRLLFSSDNVLRLNALLDPRFFPFPGRDALKRRLLAIGARGRTGLPTTRFSYREIAEIVATAGLEIDRCQTIGFGPFTFSGLDLTSEPRAIAINDWLQRRADRGWRPVQVVGAQHMILARRY